jgi:hypothetical protein
MYERTEINAEQNFYAFEYYDAARHLCILAIALSYSSLVPLILPVALMYFVIWYAKRAMAAGFGGVFFVFFFLFFFKSVRFDLL